MPFHRPVHSSSFWGNLTGSQVSPATRLLEKRRQMFEVQEALDAQKEEYLRHEDAFRRREEALRKKDVELQDSLIKFNKFLQENESKRKRAVTRAADERKQIEQKELDIERLSRQRQVKIADVRKQSHLYRISAPSDIDICYYSTGCAGYKP